MHVAITGANGFVGTALCRQLALENISYTGLVRKKTEASHTDAAVVADYFDTKQVAKILPEKTSTIVHLAARVHHPKDNDASLYVRENVELTNAVVQAALLAKVPHVILVSTIKVYGEFRDDDFTVNSPCHPESDYGKSKLEAEKVAAALCKQHGINLDIVRIPLVVGPSAKGNLGAVAKLLKMGFPLPFAGIRNRRSFVRVETLVAHLIELARKQQARTTQGEVWIHAVSEPEPVTTASLLSVFASQRGFKIRFFHLPLFMIGWLCAVLDLMQQGPSSKGYFTKSSDKIFGNAVLIPGSKKE